MEQRWLENKLYSLELDSNIVTELGILISYVEINKTRDHIPCPIGQNVLQSKKNLFEQII